MTKYELRRKEIKERKDEIRTLLAGDSEIENIDALTDELRGFDGELEKMEKREKALASLTAVSDDDLEERKLDAAGVKPEERKVTKGFTTEERAARGKLLKEDRSITVDNSSVVLPKHTANTINDTFNPVSTLVDRVRQMPLMGGESFEMPYVESYGVGGYTAQGIDYNDVETVFAFSPIGKTKLTAYQEWPEEVNRLADAPYEAMVVDGVRKAVRTKMSREILIGDGTTGHYVGIFDDNAAGLSTSDDLEVAAITNTLLDDIVYGYGGIEEVEDEAALILNKKDLRDFAKLRSTDGFRIHDIVRSSMNTGTIDSTPYIINSACIYLADATAGQYNMAYGPLENYMQAIFSDMEVKSSDDYKFKQGITAHRGSIFAGGNVIAKEGFLRIKKSA